MFALKTGPRRLFVLFLALLLGLVFLAAPIFASGGAVLPASQAPLGYTLKQAAAITAYFNEGPHTANTLPQGFPFQILYTKPDDPTNTFRVGLGTTFYVPIVFQDNAPPLPGGYFPNINDPKAVSDYYFNPEPLGAKYIEIVVDGVVTRLSPEYVVGAATPGLPSGGSAYTVAAAFLSRMSAGTHSVIIRARFQSEALKDPAFGLPDGVFEFSIPYTVIVR